MMSVRIPLAITIVALIATMTTGCTTQRWSVERSEISTNQDGEEAHASNTILLDRQTGDTWLLWPEGAQYRWNKIQR